jgi:hypothetical protein
MLGAARRHFGELEQDVAGRFRVDEGDAAIAVADHRGLVEERRALGLQLGERGVDILDLEADVKKALPLLATHSATREEGAIPCSSSM